MTKYILNTGTRPRSGLKFPHALEIEEGEGSFTEASRNPVYYESAASATGDLICFEILRHGVLRPFLLCLAKDLST